MKKVVLIVLVALIACACVFASGKSDNGQASPDDASGKVIRIGTMAKAAGLYSYVAEELGLYEEAGLNVELVTFATGAPINEAMAAGRIDVAVSGMATVYALATGMYTYLGDGTITAQGQVIFARANSPVVLAGKNAEGIYGSAETVKGKAILAPLSTTAHYLATSYVEQFGLTADDFELVSMDYAQAYEAFITGNGDMVATTPPYTNKLAEDPAYVEVADLSTIMHAPLVDCIYAQNDFVKERPQDTVALLECLYNAQDILANDPALRTELAMGIYSREGVTYSDTDMAAEIEAQTYFTWDMLEQSSFEFGATMTNIGAFYVDQGMIEEDDYPNITESMDDSFRKKAVELHKSKAN